MISKNKKGFTLIELLAVIIILGILMIIAIPSVTKYISDSRKSSYVDTAKEIISGARNVVNEGKLGMYDTNTTYYLSANYIKTENAFKSPYGDFVVAYVVVTYDGKGYSYYWISVDDAGQGVKEIVSYDKLDTDNIESDIDPDTIDPSKTKVGIGNRTEIKVLDKDGNWEHEIHLDDTSNNVPEGGVSSGGSGNSGTTPATVVCKPATTLHTKTCERTNSGCGPTVGNGNTITYGTLVSGTRKAGDAYDCDVNNDGTYDSATERFYYMKSDGANSILIYYTSMNDQERYAYDSSGENWHGPGTGYEQLPSATTWSNPGLIAPGTRQITNELGTTSTNNETNTIESFTYTNRVARLLTTQEIDEVCGSTIGKTKTGELDNCLWLMENIGYYEIESGSRSYGFWLENPLSKKNKIWYVYGSYRTVNEGSPNATVGNGIRPVITVLTSNLSN